MKNNNVFFYYVLKNKGVFIRLSILLLFGLICGIMFINYMENDKRNEISNYIIDGVEKIKSINEVNNKELLIKSISQNMLYVLIIWVLGFVFIGNILIYLVLFYKGFSLGYTISSIIISLGVKNGIVFAILSLGIQNIIFIIAIFILAQNGIKLVNIIKEKRYLNISKEAIKYTIFFILISFFIIIASLSEVYVSNNLLNLCKKFY